MILLWLIVIPLVAGLVAWLASRWDARLSRWISLLAMAAVLILLGLLWVQSTGKTGWLVLLDVPWIPQFGIGLRLSLDGLSLLLLLLTGVLSVAAVAASWTDIHERVGFFHFNLLWVLAGVMGVFLATDLFLFYFFWEMMLIPMYLLIGLWGHERRDYASIKFFIFTQASGLLMLLAILGLYLIHGQATGIYTFDYNQLLGTPLAAGAARWLMLGFLAAFLVKVPAFGVHTWLPDAHTEAPTAGSVILAGLLLKTGGYGLLRFVLPLFPQAAREAAPWIMALAVVGILYGAIMAFAQSDLKRLVAYSSVNHMGFVLLGIFAFNELATQGAVMQMLAHGLSTGALFMLVGFLTERTHTREMGQMGGLWAAVPRMGGVAMVLAMASLRLPGLANFVGEFLVLLGTYQSSVLWAVLAATGLVFSTVYSLWMIQRTFHGPNKHGWKLPDLNWREAVILLVLIALILWLGLYPQPFIDTLGQSLQQAGFGLEGWEVGRLEGWSPPTLPVFQSSNGWAGGAL
jgi:NADH-quinone oxidoreductase subunit M